MSKFGNLISQAKGNNSSEPESQQTGKQVSQKAGKNVNQKARKPESISETSKSVNLSIKVPEHLRRHWVSEAKRSGTSITAEVIAALEKKFGTP